MQNLCGPSAEQQRSTMSTKMETLDPSALADTAPSVSYNPESETVTLPGGLVSVAGITAITGGVELSCGSCMLAFGFWGTLIGISCVAVGLWDQLSHSKQGTSNLLSLGFGILALSVIVVGSVTAFYLLVRRKRRLSRGERDDGREVLVESERVIKKVTV